MARHGLDAHRLADAGGADQPGIHSRHLHRAKGLEFKAVLATSCAYGVLPNRRSLMDAVEDAFARSRELEIPFSVVLVDVDHLKRINDRYGQRAGDHVLRHLARILRETTRPADILGCYGGKQFVLAFLECEEPHARMVAERLRLRVEGEPFPADDDDRRQVPVHARFLVDQNRWRAMRYGYDEGLIDFAAAEVVPVTDLLAEILEQVRPDADELGCRAELERVLEIPVRGSSAHRQLAIYQAALGEGCEPNEALFRVVDWLVDETVHGLQAA